MDLQIIQNKIFEVRGCRVMLDLHLAELYQVETRVLKQAVKRNIDRFPSDFMFELSKDEWSGLITNCDKFPDNIRHTPTPPMAFTEQGVAMLSSVLRSKVAIEVNISIMRAFVLMRQMVIGYEELLKRIEELEVSTDAQFNELYQALTQLLSQSQQQRERRPIGFATYDRSVNKQVTILKIRTAITIYIPIIYFLSCGQSTDYPYFLSFSKGTFPETPAVHGIANCFREKSLWKPAQEHRKVNSRHTCFSARFLQCSLTDRREQELLSCFVTCKSSSLDHQYRNSCFYNLSLAKRLVNNLFIHFFGNISI